MKLYQINNLTIKYREASDRYEVWSPSGVLLEKFREWGSAADYARRTLDFLAPRTAERMRRKAWKRWLKCSRGHVLDGRLWTNSHLQQGSRCPQILPPSPPDPPKRCRRLLRYELLYE